jgi:hypothetical protein
MIGSSKRCTSVTKPIQLQSNLHGLNSLKLTPSAASQQSAPAASAPKGGTPPVPKAAQKVSAPAPAAQVAPSPAPVAQPWQHLLHK